ncbi:unnamed protein product, partial [Ectocarpus sp. 13 AM-2016]
QQSTPLRSSCFLRWRAASRRTLTRENFQENGARMYTGIQTVFKDMDMVWRFTKEHVASTSAYCRRGDFWDR